MEPPAITRREVERLAELAALSLADEEAEAMARELAKIVTYVNELSAVDTSEVGADAGTRDGSVSKSAWREDVVIPGISREEAVGGAARAADGGFAVPGFVGAGVGARPRDPGER